MRRREFVTLLGGTAAWPLAARAQQAVAKAVRIGVLVDEWSPPIEGLAEGLRERGYVEGKNLRFEYRMPEGQSGRHQALADELVALPVDVIVTWGTPAALAAKRATSIAAGFGEIPSIRWTPSRTSIPGIFTTVCWVDLELIFCSLHPLQDGRS